MRRITATLLAAVIVAAASGCGGSGNQSFSAAGYPFTFNFPSSWTLTRGAGSDDSGGSALRTVTVALKQPFDQASISQYRLKKKLPSGVNGYQPEVDRVVKRLTREAGGSAGDAKVVKYGGLPGYQYVLSYSSGGQKLQNQLTFLFQGENEFLIGCQSSPDKRNEMSDGCEQILESIEFD